MITCGIQIFCTNFLHQKIISEKSVKMYYKIDELGRIIRALHMFSDLI